MTRRLFEIDRAMHATISEDGVYRYELLRRWSHAPRLCWVMLNPSTADGTKDDPTIRRCIRFSKAWGFGGLVVVNLFALRATNPKELLTHPDPVGPENDSKAGEWLQRAPVIAAWGAHPFAASRVEWVREQTWFSEHPLRCLGVTKNGSPKHPLYVPAATEPQPFEAVSP